MKTSLQKRLDETFIIPKCINLKDYASLWMINQSCGLCLEQVDCCNGCRIIAGNCRSSLFDDNRSEDVVVGEPYYVYGREYSDRHLHVSHYLMQERKSGSDVSFDLVIKMHKDVGEMDKVYRLMLNDLRMKMYDIQKKD